MSVFLLLVNLYSRIHKGVNDIHNQVADDNQDVYKRQHQAGVKSLAMIHVKDINSVTGYIRGGCTAIGMKKQYPVFIAEAAQNYPQIVVSGGHLGVQIELAPQDLAAASKGTFCDITR